MKKLILIQSELKVPKTNVNSFGKYKYRSCEDILEELKPILKKHECQVTLTDKIVAIGNKFFLRSKAIFTDGENIEVSKGFAELNEHKGMSAEQATGTASSYSRKYALNGLFLIDETAMDADSVNDPKSTAKAPQSLPPVPQMTEEQKAKIISFSAMTIRFSEEKIKGMLEWIKKPQTQENAHRFINRLEATVAELIKAENPTNPINTDGDK